MLESILGNAVLMWCILGVVFVIIEMMTVSFFASFFAVGAVVAAIVSIWCDSILVQVVIFAVVSALAMFVGRPFLKKFFKTAEEVRPSTVNAMIGTRGTVIKEIGSAEVGQVKVNGETWTAVSDNNQIIAEGKVVEIVEIVGVKVKVKEVGND